MFFFLGFNASSKASGRKVSITNPDDFTFKNFYKSIDSKQIETVDVSLDDFDAVTRHSLLVQKKNVQVQRRRGATSKNPIKALANRTDVKNEYTEIITGVAEREKKRLNIEKCKLYLKSFIILNIVAFCDPCLSKWNNSYSCNKTYK